MRVRALPDERPRAWRSVIAWMDRHAVLFVILGLLGIAYVAVMEQRLAARNCRNIAGLARIERDFIERQEAQSRGLLEHGITFGIPKAQLPALLKTSRESQALFLHDLDALTVGNCAAGSIERKGISLPSVHRPAPHGSTAVPPAPSVPSGASLSGERQAPSSARSSPRASIAPPERRRVKSNSPAAAPVTPANPTPGVAATPTPPVAVQPPSSLPAPEPREPTITVPPLHLPCIRLPPLNVCQ